MWQSLPGSVIPSLYVKSKGETPTALMLRLTQARTRVVVRLTGGCGDMERADGDALAATFVEAFAGFAGAMLYGGTRMIDRATRSVRPGITEIPPLIRQQNPESVILGVIPRTGHIDLTEHGMAITNHDDADYVTIVHPSQDLCLVVQEGVDLKSPYDAEYLECLGMVQALRELASWNSLLVVYNGGGVTERELLAVAERGWPVLLIGGSGRTADRYATDRAFLQAHPNVTVVPRDAWAVRSYLLTQGVIVADGRPPKLSVVA